MTRNMVNLDRAAVMLATGAVGFCPLYMLLHINTSGRTLLPH